MIGRVVLISVLFVIQNSLQQQPCQCGQSCQCAALPNKDYLLGLYDQDLYVEGLQGIGQCKIKRDMTPQNACDLYVTSGIKGVASYSGYPLNTACQGTGCVKAPDFPKAVSTCWFSGSEYSPDVQASASEYCTENGIANAAAQLRDAIIEDACDCEASLVDIGVDAVDVILEPLPTPSPSPIVCKQAPFGTTSFQARSLACP